MSDKILKLSQAQTLYEDLRGRIDALPTDSDIPDVPVQDVQVNGTSVLNNGVANVPVASDSVVGVVKVESQSTSGLIIDSTTKGIRVSAASSNYVKAGSSSRMPIVPDSQHVSTFYGLAKAAGADMKDIANTTVGTYPDAQKAAIQNMLGITDLISTEEVSTATVAHAINSTFMMDGKLHRATTAIAIGDAVEVGTNCEVVKADEVFVKNTDYATTNVAGLVKGDATFGVSTVASGNNIGTMAIVRATDLQIKSGNDPFRPIVTSSQHTSIFYGLSKLAGVDLANETVTVGTYPEASKTAIRSLIGAGTPLDVQINGTSIVSSGVADIPIANSSRFGVVKAETTYGVGVQTGTTGLGKLTIAKATSAQVQAGTDSFKPIVPNNQHESSFYGLSKVAGVDLANETVTLGTYPETSKTAIRSLIGAAAVSDVTVSDVQVNGTSILANGVANIPYANNNEFGLVKGNPEQGVGVYNNGALYISGPSLELLKAGVNTTKPVTVAMQHNATFYGLAKAAGADEKNSTLSVGTYTETAKSAIRNMLGATSSNVIAVQDEQPTDTDTKVWLPETEAQGIQVPTMEDMANYVQKTDYATLDTPGLVKVSTVVKLDSNNRLTLTAATDAHTKEGNNTSFPIMPNRQHRAVFYGLAKAAGDTTQSASSNAVGTYTDDAKAAIQTMLGVPGDVQVNGTSVINNGIANIPKADTTTYGVIMYETNGAGGLLYSTSTGYTRLQKAASNEIKYGTDHFKAIVPVNQHESVFFGLAKAAGDTTLPTSNPTIGVYTSEALSAIHTMLGIDPASIAAQVDIPLIETVSGTTPSITGQPNTRYVCGEVSTISITPPASGSVDVIFESGSTAAVLTVPNTVKWPAWFDATTLEADTTYEILITDGIYGSVMTWAT